MFHYLMNKSRAIEDENPSDQAGAEGKVFIPPNDRKDNVNSGKISSTLFHESEEEAVLVLHLLIGQKFGISLKVNIFLILRPTLNLRSHRCTRQRKFESELYENC